MNDTAGCFYGIGVGPGDPQLMTLKAAARLSAVSVIAIPHSSKEQCTAYQIAVRAVPVLEDKECLFLPMPMTREAEKLESSHEAAADSVAAVLRRGEDVAFLTLGDAALYSTYLYLKERVERRGYRTEIISGITSFSAAAARLGIALANGSQELHIIPASYEIESSLKLPGVKVFMKAGKQMGRVKRLLSDAGCRAVMVENCGMEGEQIYSCLEAIPEDAGYYSLIIAWEKGEKL